MNWRRCLGFGIILVLADHDTVSRALGCTAVLLWARGYRRLACSVTCGHWLYAVVRWVSSDGWITTVRHA
jgi:hypothetical protein